MNPAAYLQRQGWRGQGHSLDTTNRGLKKPLLVAHKTDSAGLGTKQNDFTNQWWLKAWDSKPDAAPVPAPPHGPVTGFSVASNPALYSHFVKSNPLEGTILEDSVDMAKAKRTTGVEHVNGGSAADIKEAKKQKKTAEVEHVNGTSAVNGKSGKKQKKKDESHVEAPPLTSTTETPSEQDMKKSKKRQREDATPSESKEEKKLKKKDKKKHDSASKDALPTESAPAFFIDTVGDASKTPKISKSSSDANEKQKKEMQAPAPATRDTNQQNGYGNMHPDRLDLNNGTSKPLGKQATQPASRPFKKPHKVPQTAFFPDTSLSINEMVRRHEEESKKVGPDGKRPPRRAPRNIRKEARAAKQAAADAEAAARGERAEPVSVPMTKQEKRWAKRKPPTERKQKQMARKVRKQEAARQGVVERKEIEAEAQRMVAEMQANGSMPDISKPLEEILAELEADLTKAKEAEKLRKSAQKAVDALKENGSMPLDKDEEEVLLEQEQKILETREAMAKAKAEGKPWPPPKPGPDFSHVELPNLDVPTFKTVTLGIPIPGTKKRGSLKQVKAALEQAGLTREQQAAYMHKAIADKKEARAAKEKIKEERRKGRKLARARQKLARREGQQLKSQKKEKKEQKRKEAEAADPKLAAKSKKKERSAETLSHNTGIILRQREEEKRARGEEATPASKLEVKQARRAARKLVRLAKKGRLARDEVPNQFRLKRSQTLKLRGNGGRIPEWTAMDIANNVRSAQEDAIKAAEKSNRRRSKRSTSEQGEKSVKVKSSSTDGIASGASYIPLS